MRFVLNRTLRRRGSETLGLTWVHVFSSGLESSHCRSQPGYRISSRRFVLGRMQSVDRLGVGWTPVYSLLFTIESGDSKLHQVMHQFQLLIQPVTTETSNVKLVE